MYSHPRLQSGSHSHSEPPLVMWRRFGIWAVLALAGLLALGGFGRYSGVLVLGWAFGMVVAASIILLRQNR